MESFDIGVHAIIGSFLSNKDLENYVTAYNLDVVHFWILLIREAFPEYYLPQIKGLKWKKIYYGLAFYTNYDELFKKYREFNDMIRQFKEAHKKIYDIVSKASGHHKDDFYKNIFNTKEFEKMFPQIKEVPIGPDDKFITMMEKYPEAFEYLITNDLIELSTDELEYIFKSRPLPQYKTTKYMLDNFNIESDSMSIGITIALQNNNVDMAKLIYSYVKPEDVQDFTNYLDELFFEHISEQEDLSNESFDFIWEIIHQNDQLIDIISSITPENKKLLNHILDKIPIDIDKDKLINSLSDIVDRGYDEMVKIFELLMKKFGHRLTSEDKKQLLDISLKMYSPTDNPFDELLK